DVERRARRPAARDEGLERVGVGALGAVAPARGEVLRLGRARVLGGLGDDGGGVGHAPSLAPRPRPKSARARPSTRLKASGASLLTSWPARGTTTRAASAAAAR